MQKSVFIFLIVLLTHSHFLFAQKNNKDSLIILDSTKISSKKINPLAPTRAAFYSAIVPGLGQAYNKKYWKIPIVYGAMGTSIYFYVTQNKLYNSFRNEYKSRLAGNTPIEYTQYSDATLISGQRTYRRNRDLSLLITIGLYALNIIDANVDAHLKQYNVNNNLSVRPEIITNPISNEQNAGLSINFKF